MSANNQTRFVNKQMLLCKATYVPYREIADTLHRDGYWDFVRGLQRLDYNYHIGVVIQNQEQRERLLKNGLKVGDEVLSFVYHGTKNVRVYLSHLPLGIYFYEVKDFFAIYGNVEDYINVTKTLHGRKIPTGERIVIFSKLWSDIPSFIFLKGWQVAVRYSGQPKTCRFCYEQGHFADVCPNRRRQRDSPDEESEEEMDAADAEDTGKKPGGSAAEGFVQNLLETLDRSKTKQEVRPENAPGSSNSKDVKKKPDTPQQPKVSSPVEGDQSAHVEQTVERTPVAEEKMEDGKTEVKDKPLGAGSLQGDHGITKKKKKKKSSSSKAWMDKPILGSWKF